MAVSVRMERILEKELELAAQRRGISKSQFIIDAVERALGRKNPYELLLKVKADEAANGAALAKAFKGQEQAYDPDTAKQALRQKLRAKHGVGRTD